MIVIHMIFRNMFRPRCVYKSIVIFLSSVVLYALIYRNEFSMDKPISTPKFPFYIKGNIAENSTELTEYKISSTSTIKRSEIKSDKEEFQTLKYILLWTPTITPFNHIRKRGQVPFISNNCQYTNCFLTHRKLYFPDQTKFDAVVFSIAALKNLQKLPLHRSPRQKFVAASTEPPQKHPVVNPIFDGYFNWTWTYRLDSDILWRKFRIQDLFHTYIELGPKKNMKWKKWSKKYSRDPELQNFLSMKKKSIVWIKNSCEVNKYNSIQLQYIVDLENELINNGLSLETYSNCSGFNSCGNMTECSKIILHDFYFYLAFEEYIDDDYVTDTLLIALESYAVPVVFGGANYSRYLPPGSYLDARRLSPSEVANAIDNSMSDYNAFTTYFEWIFHYQYESTGLESEVCNICTALNNEKMINNVTVHYKFRKVWNGEDSVLFSDFIFKAFEDDVALKNLLANGSYTDIRKAVMKKHLPDTKDFVFVFNMSMLNITSTDETEFIPDELTIDMV